MGSSQSSIVNKLAANRPYDVTEALRLLKNQVQSPSVFTDARFFRAVLPPLAHLLGNGNNRSDTKLALLRDMSFLTVRPASVAREVVELNLGHPVEELVVPPLLMLLFSADLEVRAAAAETIDKLSPSQSLFGATEFACALVEYLKNSKDEPAKVRILPAVWLAGTHLNTVLKPVYVSVLHILLSSERNGHLKAQIIAEFRRVLHEEPTVLDAAMSTQLFYSLREIVSTHNPADVDVVVDFSYGCLMKLIPQRRSVLGASLLRGIADVIAATLSQPVVSPQYLDINCCLLSAIIDSCDESSANTISAVCISASRHFSTIIQARQLEEHALIRLSSSVMAGFTSVIAWSGLPSFPLWTPTFYKCVSTVLITSLLSGSEPVASQGASLLSRVATATGQYIQYFVGDFSLLFIIYITRLLHPSKIKVPKPAANSKPVSEADLPCATILDELYSLATTADRQHRVTKDKLIPELIFLTDYPIGAVAAPLNEDATAYEKFQADLWYSLNVIRSATCHILLCLIRVRGRTQQQLIELFTIWYDRMSFSGHFILVDVLNKALMSILVKADGVSIPLAVINGPSSNASPTSTNTALNASTATSATPSFAALSSATTPTSSFGSASSSSSNIRLSNPPVASASSSSIPSIPFSPGSPSPHTMTLVQDNDRTELQRRISEMEREMKALTTEKTQLATQLTEKSKAFTDIMNEKEQLLNQIACAVCLENILDNKPVCLECGHLFCGNCVDSVMRTHKKCPLCKSPIDRIVQVKGL